MDQQADRWTSDPDTDKSLRRESRFHLRPASWVDPEMEEEYDERAKGTPFARTRVGRRDPPDSGTSAKAGTGLQYIRHNGSPSQADEEMDGLCVLYSWQVDSACSRTRTCDFAHRL